MSAPIKWWRAWIGCAERRAFAVRRRCRLGAARGDFRRCRPQVAALAAPRSPTRHFFRCTRERGGPDPTTPRESTTHFTRCALARFDRCKNQLEPPSFRGALSLSLSPSSRRASKHIRRWRTTPAASAAAPCGRRCLAEEEKEEARRGLGRRSPVIPIASSRPRQDAPAPMLLRVSSAASRPR